MAFSDPFGLCPDKAKDGTFCIDFFIAAKTKWGFRGDNRGHDPNAPASRSRAQIIVDPNNAKATTFTASPSCFLGNCKPPSASNKVVSQPAEGGGVTVKINLKDSASPIGAAPDLDGTITVRPDGTTTGDVTAYPSNDVYQRQNGKWVPVKPAHDETDPLDLQDGWGRNKW